MDAKQDRRWWAMVGEGSDGTERYSAAEGNGAEREGWDTRRDGTERYSAAEGNGAEREGGIANSIRKEQIKRKSTFKRLIF